MGGRTRGEKADIFAHSFGVIADFPQVREAQRVISLYLAHRRDGRSREDIRENVFNVSTLGKGNGESKSSILRVSMTLFFFR